MHYTCIGLPHEFFYNQLIWFHCFGYGIKQLFHMQFCNVGCHLCDNIFRGFQVAIKCYVNSISNNKNFTWICIMLMHHNMVNIIYGQEGMKHWSFLNVL
jgi:hypothetical protein